MRTAKIPKRYENSPELIDAVLHARKLQMQFGDDAAIEYLVQNTPMMSEYSAIRCINDETFRYHAFYPKGHHGLQSLRAEQRVKGRRAEGLRKIRAQVIDRDNGRCQICGKRVWGAAATLDHKDPEGPETLENVHLLCRSCNTHKGRRSWSEFQESQGVFWELVKQQQNDRPDMICKITGLSVRGRNWKEAGCTTPDLCRQNWECDNGGYQEFAQQMDNDVEGMYLRYDIEFEKKNTKDAVQLRKLNRTVGAAR